MGILRNLTQGRCPAHKAGGGDGGEQNIGAFASFPLVRCRSFIEIVRFQCGVPDCNPVFFGGGAGDCLVLPGGLEGSSNGLASPTSGPIIAIKPV